MVLFTNLRLKKTAIEVLLAYRGIAFIKAVSEVRFRNALLAYRGIDPVIAVSEVRKKIISSKIDIEKNNIHFEKGCLGALRMVMFFSSSHVTSKSKFLHFVDTLTYRA